MYVRTYIDYRHVQKREYWEIYTNIWCIYSWVNYDAEIEYANILLKNANETKTGTYRSTR